MKTKFGTVYESEKYVHFEHRTKTKRIFKTWYKNKEGEDEARKLAKEYQKNYSLVMFEKTYPDIVCELCNYSTKKKALYKIHCKGKRHLQKVSEKEEKKEQEEVKDDMEQI